MSYRAWLNCKCIEKEQILLFVQEVCEAYRQPENVKEILKSSVPFSPYASFSPYSKDSKGAVDKLTEYWLAGSIFTLRFVYFEEYKVLALIGHGYNFLNKFFDGGVYFQNSTDQDYNYRIWDKIPPFKAIADRIKDMSKEELLEYLNRRNYGIDEEDISRDVEYFKRTAVYDTIYSSIEKDLWDTTHALTVCCEIDPVRLFKEKLYIKYLTAKDAVGLIENSSLKVAEDIYHPSIIETAKKIQEGKIPSGEFEPSLLI